MKVKWFRREPKVGQVFYESANRDWKIRKEFYADGPVTYEWVIYRWGKQWDATDTLREAKDLVEGELPT